MKNWHIGLEPQLHYTVDFLIRAETKEKARKKLESWCNGQVEQTRKAFEGQKDQASMTRFKRKYWDTGLHNSFTREIVVKPHISNYDHFIA